MGRHSNYALIRPTFAGLLDEDEIYSSVVDDLDVRPQGDLWLLKRLADDGLNVIKWREHDDADDERYRHKTRLKKFYTGGGPGIPPLPELHYQLDGRDYDYESWRLRKGGDQFFGSIR